MDMRCSELLPPGAAKEPYTLLPMIVGFIDKSIITFFVVELKFIPVPAPWLASTRLVCGTLLEPIYGATDCTSDD